MTKDYKAIVDYLVNNYNMMSRGDLQAEVEAIAMMNGFDADELLCDIDDAYALVSADKKPEIQCYLVDPVSGEYGSCKIVDTLENLYQILGCDSIEIVKRRINGIWFTVVCDGEGRLKPNNKVSGVNHEEFPEFVGPILIFNGCDSPNLMPLTDAEVRYVDAFLLKGAFSDGDGNISVNEFILFD